MKVVKAARLREKLRQSLREDPFIPNDIVRIQRKWTQFPVPKYGAEDESIIHKYQAIVQSMTSLHSSKSIKKNSRSTIERSDGELIASKESLVQSGQKALY